MPNAFKSSRPEKAQTYNPTIQRRHSGITHDYPYLICRKPGQSANYGVMCEEVGKTSHLTAKLLKSLINWYHLKK